jgi:predicted negative regulator of RcsB-dependent stress response
MTENLIGTKYEISKKEKILNFYKKNKAIVYSLIIFFLIIISVIFVYIEIKEKKNIQLSENYIEAKIHLENNNKDKAKVILRNLVYESDNVYSAMSLFLILNNRLIDDDEEINNLFNYILKEKNFDKELKYLITLKKTVFQSNSFSETDLLNTAKPLINSDSLWKPFALLILGDYFVSKNEKQKAKDFYIQVLSIKGIQQELYNLAQSQLKLIN